MEVDTSTLCTTFLALAQQLSVVDGWQLESKQREGMGHH